MHESHRGHKLGPGVSRPVVILQYSVCQEWDVAVARSQWRECLQEALILWKPWRYFDISKLLYGSNRKVCPVEMVSINPVFILQSCSWFIGFAWYSWFYAIRWERVPVTREFMSELKKCCELSNPSDPFELPSEKHAFQHRFRIPDRPSVRYLGFDLEVILHLFVLVQDECSTQP